MSKKFTVINSVFWIVAIIIVSFMPSSLGGKFFKLIEALYVALPACVTFGPVFLLFGIILSLGGKDSANFKKGIWTMIVGTLMITYALYALLHLAWH